MLATGEEGIVLTDREDLAMAVRELRAYDGAPACSLRFNCKMTDLAVSLARVRLRCLPEFVARRRALAKLYDRAFADREIERSMASRWAQCIILAKNQRSRSMKLALGGERGGFPIKELLGGYLIRAGREAEDYGSNSTEPVDFSDIE